MSTSATVCFVACHGEPAEHFAAFADNLARDRCPVQVHATGPALAAFNGRRVQAKPFSLTDLSAADEDTLAIKIAKANAKATVVFTDIGHPFADKIQKAFALHARNVRRIAYYDSPEKYVPGGYSDVATKIMMNAETVAFANEKLVTEGVQSAPGKAIDLSKVRRIGIGYHPDPALGVQAEWPETLKKTIRDMELIKTVNTLGQALRNPFEKDNELSPKSIFQVSRMMQVHGVKAMVSTLKYAFDSKNPLLRLSCATIAHTILKKSPDLNLSFLAEVRSQLTTPSLYFLRLLCMQVSAHAREYPVYQGTFS